MKSVLEELKELLSHRILVLDGAMGTMIQKHSPEEEDYRGSRFADWAHSVKGNNELLSITCPEMIKDIHLQYFEAGSDIVETNTFSANRISQADYHMEELVWEMNVCSARLACEARDEAMRLYPERRCFVAGAVGPTNRTASLSPDVNDPGYRAVTFSGLAEAYLEQVSALAEGGVDLFLIETIFDTLNAKAAIYAIKEWEERSGRVIPIMISGTITDASGRTLSGQTVEAFWNSVSHASPLTIGLNCALGASDMYPYIRELSEKSWCYISAYPNAGLPNAFGEYDQTGPEMAALVKAFMKEGLINVIGGCCGTTPSHIKVIAQAAKECAPRVLPSIAI
jgi:5-methyltetrahydrofolate--homocysteine methyltransferase